MNVKELTKTLIFYSTDKKPTIDYQDRTAILYNPCDGYHTAGFIIFYEDGEFDGFYPFLGERFSDDFYIYWAVLPKI